MIERTEHSFVSRVLPRRDCYARNMSRLAMLLLLAAGCGRSYPATVGTNQWNDTPKDSAERCEEICKDIGLPLGAVVVMANNVGCVCNAAAPPPAPAQTPSAGATGTAAGMATIMLQEEEDDARRRRNNSGSGHVGIKHL